MNYIQLRNFINNRGFLKYFKNTSWLLVDKVLRIILGLFIGVWVAKYLGPKVFGVFSYVNSVVGLFSAIAAMGLNELIVREIVKNNIKINTILGTSFLLKIIGVFFVFVLLGITICFTKDDYYTNSLIFILVFGLLFQSFNVIEFYFQSQVASKYIFIVNTCALIVSSVLKIALILFKADLIMFVIVTSFDFVIIAIGYIYIYKKKTAFTVFKWGWDSSLAKSLLKESWPLIISSLSFVIYNNIDKIMLKNMMDDYSVGVYSAASRLTFPWQFIPGLIISSLMPALVSSHQNSFKLFHSRIKQLGSLLIWIAILMSVFYSLFSDEIIRLTFGAEFIDASGIMVYLIWANVLIFFNSLWNRWMLIEGNTKITFYFSLTTSVLNIILNYFMIINFGVKGACISIIISLFISSFIFYVVIDNRVFKVFYKAFFFIN